MRKFKTAKPLSITEKLRKKIARSRKSTEGNPHPLPPTEKPSQEDFEAMMAKAFPEHLRGSISGCCDSMEDGRRRHK